jgi:hypothetical protein
MSTVPSDGWAPGTVANDRQMIDWDDETPPQGKKWECCSACQGKGKVLVDDDVAASIQRPGSVPLSTGGSDGVKRFVMQQCDVDSIVIRLKNDEGEIIRSDLAVHYDAWHVNEGKRK